MKTIDYACRLIAVILVTTLALFSQSAEAVTYQTTQVSNFVQDSWSPQIDGDNVVWYNGNFFDATTYQIFHFDGFTTTQITNDAAGNRYPEVSGDNIIWTGGADIWLHDGVTTTALSSGDVGAPTGQIDGDNVVWYSAGLSDSEIFLYDGVTTTQLTNNSVQDSDPHVSGNNVVWTRESGDDSEIFLYDGVTTTQLTNNLFPDQFPQISGDNVVWRGDDGNDGVIYLYDGVTTTQISNNGFDNFAPQVSGNTVVWQGFDGNDWEIYQYDGVSTTQLTNNNVNDTVPQIDGNHIVWQQGINADTEIFLHDGVTTMQLTNNEGFHGGPQVSGDTAVWQQGASEIFVSTPIDHASNASFEIGSDVNTLTIDFGTLPILEAAAPIGFSLANLIGFGGNVVDTARLSFVDNNGTGDVGTLTTDLNAFYAPAPHFSELAAGSSLDFNASIDTSLPGTFEATYEISVTDALGTDQTLTLTLQGVVDVIDDPAVPDLIYNAATGEVILDPDASPGIIGYTLKNLNDAFLPGNHTPILGGVATSLTSEIGEASFNGPAAPTSIGNIFPLGLDLLQLVTLLSENTVSTGLGHPLVPFDLIVLPAPVPEPSTYVMALAGLFGLLSMGRQRRQR